MFDWAGGAAFSAGAGVAAVQLFLAGPGAAGGVAAGAAAAPGAGFCACRIVTGAEGAAAAPFIEALSSCEAS